MSRRVELFFTLAAPVCSHVWPLLLSGYCSSSWISRSCLSSGRWVFFEIRCQYAARLLFLFCPFCGALQSGNGYFYIVEFISLFFTASVLLFRMENFSLCEWNVFQPFLLVFYFVVLYLQFIRFEVYFDVRSEIGTTLFSPHIALVSLQHLLKLIF